MLEPIRYDYGQVGSTNDEAKKRIADHPGRPVLVTAIEQTGGRGSHGRPWRSPVGGAWFSLALTLPKHDPAISLIVGQVVLDVLQNYTDGLTLKEPNDILRDSKKLVGILCEQTVTPGQPQTTSIIGVGINANFPATQLGTDLRTPPISLLDILGREIDLEKLIDSCAAAILRRLVRA